MSKVKRITVSNLKAVSELTADFNGCTAIITGGNNKGKSSFLRSLPDRLRQQKPDKILKEGEVEGFAEWELTTGEKLIWEFNSTTKQGEKLILVTKEDIKTPITREIASMFFPKGFDIDKFLSSSSRQQKEQLLQIIGVDLSEIEERYKEAYENRTFIKKTYDNLLVQKIEEDPEAPKEAIDTSEIVSEISSVDVHNERYQMVIKGIEEKKQSVEDYKEQIKELQSRINTLQDNIKLTEVDIKNGEEWISKDKNKPKDEVYVKSLKAKLEDAEEKNKKFENNAAALKINLQIEESRKEVEKAENLVKDILKEKDDVIKASKLPQGFEITDDGITYTGLPFTKEQLSSSRIYIGALKLAAMAVGRVRTLHFDASFLDKNSLKEIETWANQNDLQLLIERPDFEGGEIEYHILEK